ncbi:hypothetical protein F4861DRAFT_522111 [Xylaria intraflava]|nr:hypothetical protein F4861DRAFT_522111 [Xylaria intraflava]
MAFNIYTSDSDSKTDSREGILQSLRDMIKRVDPRGSYHIEPTWRVNGMPVSRSSSPDLPHPRDRRLRAGPDLSRIMGPKRYRKYDYGTRLSFNPFIRGLHSSELREVIMNACLKNMDTHRDVISILKRMQKRRPRPISHDGRVRNPTVGLYLYCRTQRELVDIVLELERNDDTGYFKQDVRDLVMVMKEKEGNRRFFA